jgi:ATP-dependent Clp protease ATP-binding subunit ClpC
MKVSASIELIWQLAGQEAIAGKFKSIEPEHFCMALLKFSELPVEEVDKIASGAEVARELAAEVNAVRDELENRSIDSTRTRRALRGQLGNGGSPYGGGRMHRSQASRDLIDAAARLANDAGSETLVASHVLEALLALPTPAIKQVLGEGAGRKVSGSSKTPLLDEYGKDLMRMAADGELSTAPDRKTEGKSLVQVLTQTDGRSVLLLTDSDKDARSVVVATVNMAAGPNRPKDMKGKRIVDVTSVKPSKRNADEAWIRLENLLEEAATVKDIILHVPAIQDDEKDRMWVDLLKAALTRGDVQCICRFDPNAFDHLIKKDPEWKRLAHVMRIQETTIGEIPWEL